MRSNVAAPLEDLSRSIDDGEFRIARCYFAEDHENGLFPHGRLSLGFAPCDIAAQAELSRKRYVLLRRKFEAGEFRIAQCEMIE